MGPKLPFTTTASADSSSPPPTAVNQSVWGSADTTHTSNQFISNVCCCLLTIPCCDVAAFKRSEIGLYAPCLTSWEPVSCWSLQQQCWGRWKGALNFLQQEAHVANANSFVMLLMHTVSWTLSISEVVHNSQVWIYSFPSCLCSHIYHSINFGDTQTTS